LTLGARSLKPPGRPRLPGQIFLPMTSSPSRLLIHAAHLARTTGLATAIALLRVFDAALALANPRRGLPPAPEGLDRSTPQRTVELFLDATREGDFVLAAYALDLRHLPLQQQAAQGPELARQLRYVLDRGLPLNPADVS